MSEPEASQTAPTPLMTTPSLLRRMACWLYEGVLMFGVVFVAGFLFGALRQTHNPLEGRHLLQGFMFVVFAVYFTWFWSKGQTLAMRTWHIRVVTREGRPLTQTQAFIRYLLSWMWLLPALILMAPLKPSGTESVLLVLGWVWIWALLSRFHPTRQFLHDVVAGTRLISTSSASSPGHP